MKKGLFGLKRGLTIVLIVLLALVAVGTPLMNTLVITNSSTIDNAIMGTSHAAADVEEDDLQDTYDEEAIKALGTRIGEEGYVLLQNQNNALPIEKDNVTVNILGIQYINFVYGGGGSGRLDSSNAVRLEEALEQAGFTVNEKLDAFNRSYAEAHNLVEEEVFTALNIGLGQVTTFVEEIPVSEYAGQDFGDTGVALIVFGRRGAEEADLSEAVLTLNDNEKALLKYARETYETVIVVVNSSNVMALGDEEINVENCADAVIWVGNPGNTDLIALGSILNGSVNPSGRTVDTWAYTLSSAPALLNNGVYYEYANTDVPFTTYSEGIYVGYRWYTTAHEEGVLDYNEAVRYSFGYGLSYTSFDWEMGELSEREGVLSVPVTVTNTGDRAGKEVVEIYFTAPYDEAEGIEKSHLVLAGFAKTQELAPGESETVTVSWNRRDMASYDDMHNRCYVLSGGEYIIRAMRSSHPEDEVAQRIYTVASTELIRESVTGQEITNLFDHANGLDEGVVYLSRAGHFANYEEAIQPGGGLAGTNLSEKYLEMLEVSWNVTNVDYYDGSELTMPTQSDKVLSAEEVKITLYELEGLDYDDPLWDEFLDQWTFSQLAKFSCDGGYASGGVAQLGVPETSHMDGPVGLHTTFEMTPRSWFFYPCAATIASTWNVELAEEMGEAIGSEAYHIGTVGWYGPGMNIHRSPVGGRNYEYYSEDGTLTAKIAAAAVQGATSKGILCFVKHFAVNDQETERHEIICWVNEQSMREIYLKGFEGTVVEGKTTALMSSFNRIGAVWAGADYNLLTNLLRKEWGFEGVVLTDYFGGDYMNPVQGVRAGNDWLLAGRNYYKDLVQDQRTNPTAATYYTRQAVKNICYALVNCPAVLKVIGEGTQITTTVSFTETVVLVWNIASAIIVGAVALYLILWFTVIQRKKAMA